MMRRFIAAVFCAALFALGSAASAEDGETKTKKDYVFLTGLDFSYWAADAGPNIGGPGLTVGFVLIPRHLELGFAIGAMMGGHQFTIPFETSLTVPFHVTRWFVPYIKFGPTAIADKMRDVTSYDFAFSASVGIELVPVGFDWGLYVSGDYNVRTVQEIRHQGGFTVGFHYRV